MLGPEPDWPSPLPGPLSKGANKKPRLSVSEVINSASDDVSRAEVELAKEEVKKSVTVRKDYQNAPEKVRKEVGKYALINGTKAAVNKFSKIYPKYKSKRTSVNTWK